MNETQKENFVRMTAKDLSVYNVFPCVKKEDGKILRVRFLRNGVDLTLPVCWCLREGCRDCERTKEADENVKAMCEKTCNETNKCYLCAR
nr:hypothetical protein MarFTME_269 [Marseillevirus futianmevirus]